MQGNKDVHIDNMETLPMDMNQEVAGKSFYFQKNMHACFKSARYMALTLRLVRLHPEFGGFGSTHTYI